MYHGSNPCAPIPGFLGPHVFSFNVLCSVVAYRKLERTHESNCLSQILERHPSMAETADYAGYAVVLQIFPIRETGLRRQGMG